MGKGEIACYEQFLLFPQCFQKACFPGGSKGVIVWEWVNCFANSKFSSDFLEMQNYHLHFSEIIHTTYPVAVLQITIHSTEFGLSNIQDRYNLQKFLYMGSVVKDQPAYSCRRILVYNE